MTAPLPASSAWALSALKYGFRYRVLGHDPYADPCLAALADVEMMRGLYDLLDQAPVLVLAPALTDETRNMISAAELAAVGRGQVLDLDALAERPGKRARASGRSRCFLPGAPPERAPLARSAAEQIGACLKGDMPRFAVNSEAWTRPKSRQPV